MPPDTGLIIEVRDIDVFLGTPGGAQIAELLSQLFQAEPTPSTAPASHPATASAPAGTQPARTWQALLGEKLGLRNAKAAHMLFTGRLGVAADSWGSLGDAILLAQPRGPAGLEGELQALRLPETAGTKVRRYKLDDLHELATDGRFAVIGRPGRPQELYSRMIQLWSSDRRVALADLADFRERLAALSADSQLVFYAGGAAFGSARVGRRDVLSAIPDFQSAALGVIVTGEGLAVDITRRLKSNPAPGSSDPPVESLLKAPDSALIAWTQSIRYAEAYRQIVAMHPEGPVRFYIDLLQAGLPAGTIEQGLLAHLVGDSVLLIGHQPAAFDRAGPPGAALLLPTLAVAVETDNPDSVLVVLGQVADNLLKLLNLQQYPGGPLALRESRPEGIGEIIRSIPLGPLFADRGGFDFLSGLEISWTVSDRWLVVSTASETVRQIVEARRRPAPPDIAAAIEAVLRRVRAQGATPQLAMFARPAQAAGMLDSWHGYVAARYPEMLQPDWWQRLRQRQQAANVQLGLLPAPPTTQPGVVVEQTLPAWPAHGQLQPGDRIVAVDGRPIDAQQPMASLRKLVAARPKPEQVVLRVVRGEQELDVIVAMKVEAGTPERIQPFELLRGVSDLLRIFSFAGYVTWQPSPDTINARLEVRLATQSPPVPEPPKVVVSLTGPATAPAVASAPAPVAPVAVAPATSPAPASAPAPTTTGPAPVPAVVSPPTSAPATAPAPAPTSAPAAASAPAPADLPMTPAVPSTGPAPAATPLPTSAAPASGPAVP